jgi:peptidyl-prolyl cis-trans isomerase SurA
VIKIKKIIILFFILILSVAKTNATIQDSIFATVGSKAVTQSDIVKEIKIILILSGQSFSEEQRKALEATAIQTTIKRTIKRIGVEDFPSLSVKQSDITNQLDRLAKNIDVDVETLESIFIANGIDFANVVEQITLELKWNNLITELYSDQLRINTKEIDEKLKSIKLEKSISEYLLSEIVIKPSSNETLNFEIEELKKKIMENGFESVAVTSSISETSAKSGDLGWVSENIIAENLKPYIETTDIGNITKPILLPEGVLLLKVRDKRESKKKESLEDAKNKLINAEKSKILDMFSSSYYDRLRRSLSINYY